MAIIFRTFPILAVKTAPLGSAHPELNFKELDRLITFFPKFHAPETQKDTIVYGGGPGQRHHSRLPKTVLPFDWLD